jgi:hypothetical protein
MNRKSQERLTLRYTLKDVNCVQNQIVNVKCCTTSLQTTSATAEREVGPGVNKAVLSSWDAQGVGGSHFLSGPQFSHLYIELPTILEGMNVHRDSFLSYLLHFGWFLTQFPSSSGTRNKRPVI